MANAAGYPGGQTQYPPYVAGQYYPGVQQHQAYAYPYYPANAPPYGVPGGVNPATVGRPVPPPPPPPPGEVTASVTTAESSVSVTNNTNPGSGPIPPLELPPLPPLFPWMSPALAQSMTGSQYGQKFKEEASNLPFVPIVVNDDDLAKMTEKVIKETEEANKQEMKFYKDVISQDLPEPLLAMFQPLYCKLCILSLSSPVVAKDHYNGKRHKKAIDAWFIKNPQYQRKSEVSINQIPLGTGQIRPVNGFVTKAPTPLPSPANPAPPSLLQSHQNFEAKSSCQPTITDRKRPLPPMVPPPVGNPPPSTQQQSRGPPPPGHFNMQRSLNQKEGPSQNNSVNQRGPNQNSSHDAKPNNEDFPQQMKRPKWDGTPQGRPPPLDAQGQGHAKNIGPIPARGQGGGGGPPPRDRCEICNVQLTSKVQADQHFRGSKHAQKLAEQQEQMQGTPISASVPSNVPILPPQLNPAADPTNVNPAHKASSTSTVTSAVPQNPPPIQQRKPSPPPPSHRGGGRGSGHVPPIHRGGGRGRGGARDAAPSHRGGGRGGNNSGHGAPSHRGGAGRGGSGGRPPFSNNKNNNRFGNNNRGGGPRFK